MRWKFKCPECELFSAKYGHSSKCSRRYGVVKTPPPPDWKFITITALVSPEDARAITYGNAQVLTKYAGAGLTIREAPWDPSKSVKDTPCPRCGDRHLCFESCHDCACGEAVVSSIITEQEMNPVTGWLHTRWKCTPPPDPNYRCECGFAILRNDKEVGRIYKDQWSSAIYGSDDPKGYERCHYPKQCMDHVDF
jgi:hypothetical protein